MEIVDLADIPQVDLRLYRGDTAKLAFALAGADGAPFALDGATLRMRARRREGSPVLFELSSEGETGGIARSADGVIIRIDSSVTKKAVWKEAVYDVEAAFGEDCRTLWRGRLTLVHDITGV